MKIETKVVENEEISPITPPLRIVITGSREDELLQGNLIGKGHEVIFVQSKNEVEDILTTFSFSHMQAGINHASKNAFDIVIGVSREFRKISVAVRKEENGAFILLNVNQLAAILTYHWVEGRKGSDFVVLRSIHVSEMLDSIMAKRESKYMSQLIAPGMLESTANELLEKEAIEVLVGFTENQEFYSSEKSFDEIVDDIATLEQVSRKADKTLFDALTSLYIKYGFFKEKAFMVDIVSEKHRKHLLAVMNDIRRNPKILDDKFPISRLIDYNKGITLSLLTQKKTPMNVPQVNVLRLETETNTSITFVPTEDKMYYYVSIKARLNSKETYAEENRYIDDRMIKLMQIINTL